MITLHSKHGRPDVIIPDQLAFMVEESRETGSPIIWHQPAAQSAGTCRNCNGLGFFVVSYGRGADGRDLRHEFDCPVCSDNPEGVKERRIAASGVPVARRHYDLGWTREHQPVLGRALDFIVSGRQNAYGLAVIQGSYGLGKTGAAIAAINELAKAGADAVYTSAQTILNELYAAMDAPGASVAGILDRYSRIQALAIDEVDRVGDSQWARAQLFTLINARYDAREIRATILCTNADLASLTGDEQWGYLADRLKDGFLVNLDGRSFRGE